MSAPSWSWLIPVVLFVALHTGTLIWFLSSTRTTLQYLAEQVRELKSEIGSVRTADARLGVLTARIEDLVRRVTSLESGVE